MSEWLEPLIRFVGLPLCGTVDVRTGLVAPAIQTWGFIKAGGTLRVFLYININI
jgi:hypothetical protein